MKKTVQFTRRGFLKLLGAAALDFFLLAVGGTAYGFLMEPNRFTVETVHLKLPRLSPRFSGFRVAQISDIHMGGWMNPERLQRVADLVLAQKPDVILITGDFLIGYDFNHASRQALEDLITGLSPLADSVPTFAVLGNHDYWINSKAVRGMLRAAEITDLTNRVFTITRDDEHLHLCGVDDVWDGNVRLDEVLAQLNGDGAAILMAHEPDFADTSAATGRFDLQLSLELLVCLILAANTPADCTKSVRCSNTQIAAWEWLDYPFESTAHPRSRYLSWRVALRKTRFLLTVKLNCGIIRTIKALKRTSRSAGTVRECGGTW